VDGLMIQREISIGHEHKNQQIQVVLDQKQVHFHFEKYPNK
jgi:hypothetical protein